MSTVVLDTITGKSTATTITIGSTPVVSSSANSMTIRGEGSNQTSIQQGLAKAWVSYTTLSSTAVADSFNVGSLTDNNTGDTHINFSTNFGSVNYTAGGLADGSYAAHLANESAFEADKAQIFTLNNSNSVIDAPNNTCNFHGDLA